MTEWHKAKRWVPINGEPVLTYTAGGYYHVGYYSSCDKMWYNDRGEFLVVMFWTPIPSPPEVEA